MSSGTDPMQERARLPGTPEPMCRVPASGGLEIAADVWGDQTGPLVLLQHGGGQTRHAWKGAGQMLADAGYQAVAFDARGHGDSQWDPHAAYSTLAMVEDLLHVAAHFGDARPVLVGASMGGGTSLVAVGEGFIDAKALVLVDVAPRTEPEGVQKIHAFMYGNPDGFETLEEAAAAIARYQPHREHPKDLRGLVKNLRRSADDRYHWHWDPRIAFGSGDDGRHQRYEACARSLDVPTLLVRGGLSDVLSERGAAEFLEICPTAEYVNVAGAAHMVAGDRNDIFASSVTGFLERNVPPTSGRTPPDPAADLVFDRAASKDITDIP